LLIQIGSMTGDRIIVLKQDEVMDV